MAERPMDPVEIVLHHAVNQYKNGLLWYSLGSLHYMVVK